MRCLVLAALEGLVFVVAKVGLRLIASPDITAVRELSHFCKNSHRVNTWQFLAKIIARNGAHETLSDEPMNRQVYGSLRYH
jgi:hypothetical protein